MVKGMVQFEKNLKQPAFVLLENSMTPNWNADSLVTIRSKNVDLL